MKDPDNLVHLSKLRVKTSMLRSRYPDVHDDADSTAVLRSVLMKPEYSGWIERIHASVEEHLQSCPDD